MSQNVSDMEVDEQSVSANNLSNIPWVEKYRPRTLDDVAGNPQLIERFKYFAKNGNIPHLILAGPPGCGKTTTIHAMAHEMLGVDFRRAVLELNASDDRGIDVVRQRIRRFAETHVQLPLGKHKIIILDEVDSMTDGAQQALRRIMENFSSTTRFMLACNQSDRVIEPIQSRCAIIKYSRLSSEELKLRVEQVAKKENVDFTDDGIEAIWQTSQGDLRQALNHLQCTASGYGRVTADSVYKVCDEPDPTEIAQFFGDCQVGQFDKAFAYLDKQRRLGHAFHDIINVLNRTLFSVDLPEVLKYEYVKVIGESQLDAYKGHTSRLQLAALAANLSLAIRNLQ